MECPRCMSATEVCWEHAQPIAPFGVNATAAAANPMYWSSAAAWPSGAPPPSPVFPDPRLFAIQEQIAKALERIADALEGLKPAPPPLRCGTEYETITGHKLICNLPMGHPKDAGHFRTQE